MIRLAKCICLASVSTHYVRHKKNGYIAWLLKNGRASLHQLSKSLKNQAKFQVQKTNQSNP